MSNRTIVTIAAASILCVACVATEAMAYRGGGARVGGYHGGVYRGGAYRGAYVRRGVGAQPLVQPPLVQQWRPRITMAAIITVPRRVLSESALQLSYVATRTRRLAS